MRGSDYFKAYAHNLRRVYLIDHVQREEARRSAAAYGCPPSRPRPYPAQAWADALAAAQQAAAEASGTTLVAG
jgi:hypothetical protein